MFFTHELEAMGVREPGAALTHGIACIAFVVVSILLIIRAAVLGGAWHIIGVSIFSITLISTYAISMSYHLVPYRSSRAKAIMQRLDHAFIFFLIAGTYTPICLTILRGPWGWSLLATVWAVGIIGFVLKASGLHFPNWLGPLIYILLGWMAVIAIVPIYYALGWSGLAWLLGGGIAYTLGVIFFVLDRHIRRTKWWGMHEIFHLFIMLGSALHIVLIWKFVLTG
ncbi:MAG: hemolysin III family protein [Candidatus Vogelbacteria bacterium]|nr:hemolysin III family protein [Candidatus Vogelbacteria bacterium]